MGEVKHHGCNGTGAGSRVHARCRVCKGTGLAHEAFAYFARRMGLADSTLILDTDGDHILDCYVRSRYGDTTTLVGEEDDKRGAYVYTVLQHTIDREALRTVRILGGLRNVFNWLRGEEEAHCPAGAEKGWSP